MLGCRAVGVAERRHMIIMIMVMIINRCCSSISIGCWDAVRSALTWLNAVGGRRWHGSVGADAVGAGMAQRRRYCGGCNIAEAAPPRPPPPPPHPPPTLRRIQYCGGRSIEADTGALDIAAAAKPESRLRRPQSRMLKPAAGSQHLRNLQK